MESVQNALYAPPQVYKRPKTPKGRNGHGAHETGSGRTQNGLQAYSSRNRSRTKRKGHGGRRGRLYGPMRSQSGGGFGPVTIVAARSRPPCVSATDLLFKGNPRDTPPGSPRPAQPR